MVDLTSKSSLRIAAVLLCLLVLTGCSVERNPVANAPASNTNASTGNDKSAMYPTWTDDQIAHLIPGFRVLRAENNGRGAQENLDSQTSVRILKILGGTVNHRNNGVQIGPWQLWEDQTVTVSTPNPGSAIVDFYPHPYHFNGCIRMWIDLSNFQLPPGHRWDEVAFFYVEEDGTLTRYWGQIDLLTHRYYAWPDHFSRYILALPED
jgi:hypothetical protein